MRDKLGDKVAGKDFKIPGWGEIQIQSVGNIVEIFQDSGTLHPQIAISRDHIILLLEIKICFTGNYV